MWKKKMFFYPQTIEKNIIISQVFYQFFFYVQISLCTTVLSMLLTFLEIISEPTKSDVTLRNQWVEVSF
jgi:hypothetical protein